MYTQVRPKYSYGADLDLDILDLNDLILRASPPPGGGGSEPGVCACARWHTKGTGSVCSPPLRGALLLMTVAVRGGVSGQAACRGAFHGPALSVRKPSYVLCDHGALVQPQLSSVQPGLSARRAQAKGSAARPNAAGEGGGRRTLPAVAPAWLSRLLARDSRLICAAAVQPRAAAGAWPPTSRATNMSNHHRHRALLVRPPAAHHTHAHTLLDVMNKFIQGFASSISV